MLNEWQARQLEQTADSLPAMFQAEVKRLIASGGVSPDSAGAYPLSTIFRVALENTLPGIAIVDKKVYNNLKKF
jgi:hypothetical protein